MPSLSLLATTTTTTFSSSSSFSGNNKSLVSYQPPVRVGKQVVKYTCCQKKQSRSHDKESNNGASNIDRRNMLFGLGGIYGAASTTIGTDLAMGAPFAPPDLKTCGPAFDPQTGKDLACCPSKEFIEAPIVDFKPPYSYGDDWYHKHEWNHGSGGNHGSGNWSHGGNHGSAWKQGSGNWKQGSGNWKQGSGSWKHGSGGWNQGSGSWKQGSGGWNQKPGSRFHRNPDFSWKDYKQTKLRVRKPAHEFTQFEVQRFEAAIKAMKDLKPDDPWNFYQQALIHCTYCNTAYPQAGSDKKLQVHGSWFFLPWHRMYLYFWEKILGTLIKDPTFTIPFWNWDNPKAMKIPKWYLNAISPVYDEKRNLNHYDLPWDFLFSTDTNIDPPPSEEEMVIKRNMFQIHRTFAEAATNPQIFMGNPLRAGEDADSIGISGTCERLHDPMHGWVGSLNAPDFHDMGNFSTAARDTLFWAHHGNIDRMWDLYNKGWNNGKPEFADNDWLDSTFLFYDENRKVVRIKVRDVLTPEQLGYTYQSVETPWVDRSQFTRAKKAAAPAGVMTRSAEVTIPVEVFEFGSSPRVIDGHVRAITKRPKASRTDIEKDDATEVLIVDGIEFKDGMPGRVDVYVTTETSKGEAGADKGELAGSFVNIPHGRPSASSPHNGMKHRLDIGITEFLEDLDIEDAETLVVTLVTGHKGITVDGIRIELVQNPKE